MFIVMKYIMFTLRYYWVLRIFLVSFTSINFYFFNTLWTYATNMFI
jgi:hypothetical protein